jgi:hypothetical protein
LADAPELRLLLAVSVYWMIGLAAFLALSLRKAVPALVLTLVLLGFSLTVDSASRVLWLALVFLILAACLLVFSRGIERARWRLRDVLAGGAVGVVAIFLALALLGAAPSAVATPWQDWRAWDPFRQNGSVYSFNWLQNYPGLLDPGKNVVIMRVESPAPPIGGPMLSTPSPAALGSLRRPFSGDSSRYRPAAHSSTPSPRPVPHPRAKPSQKSSRCSPSTLTTSLPEAIRSPLASIRNSPCA